jgi:UPF0176 protein
MRFLNIAAYKFVEITDAVALREVLLLRCEALALKGTVLLAPEGINIFLAGSPDSITQFLSELKADLRFADLIVKESFSANQPFGKLLIKLKQEIITMRQPDIRPIEGRAAAVLPETLKQWLDQGHDEAGREIVLLDTRNHFEVEQGTFNGAIEYNIERFSQFPQAIAPHIESLSKKRVVTFCTGGIRCEKAAIYMQNLGVEHVTQLDGGILKYFEDVGQAHYTGRCFVFDERVSLDEKLDEHQKAAT